MISQVPERPTPPHSLLFGRYPVGFGDMPPIVDDNGCEDALDFFLHLGHEREEVQQKLAAIQEKQEKELCKMHTEKCGK